MKTFKETLSTKIRSGWKLLPALLMATCFAGISYGAAQGRYDEQEGKYLDPQVKTNINKVEPLFEENIKDYKGFEKELLEHKKGITERVKRGEGTNDIPGSDKAQNAARDLSNISANELESKGRAEIAKNRWMDELFVDYSKPGNMQIKEDMKNIAEGTGNLMKSLLGKLKDLGVDCKSVKGNKQVEPEYFIDLKNRQLRDKGETIYDQYFCEQPRREYNCRDELKLTCKRKGMKWGDWQDKQIKVPAKELLSAGEHFFHITYDFNYILHLAPIWAQKVQAFIYPERNHIEAMRRYLTTKHPNSSIDNISDQMIGKREGREISIAGEQYLGRTLGSKDLAFEYYVINYKYRDGKLSCMEWNEDWSETCLLQ